MLTLAHSNIVGDNEGPLFRFGDRTRLVCQEYGDLKGQWTVCANDTAWTVLRMATEVEIATAIGLQAQMKAGGFMCRRVSAELA